MASSPPELEELIGRAEKGDVDAQIDLAFYYERVGAPKEAQTWMNAAADAGGAFARIQRAAWRLYGSNFQRDAVAALAELEDVAATSGDARAYTFAALLRASGLGAPRSWTKAIDWLTIAAANDEPSALTQLALLQPADADGARLAGLLLGRACALGHGPALAAFGGEPAPRTPRQCAAAISDAGAHAEDPASWSPGAHEIFCKRPRVDIYGAVAPAAWRRYIMALATPRLKPAEVKDAATGRPARDAMRTNTLAIFELWDSDLVFHALTMRIAAASGERLERQEAPRVLRYAPGEQYAPHFDFIDPDVPAFHDEIANQGQRIKTPLIYLNDDYTGGATRFPDAGCAFKGKAGDLLILRNVRSNGKPDRKSIHAGAPPVNGVKWILSARTRNKPQIARIWP
ncbi:MAG: 2OG-Fe(II) oxygenase [Pseudomonadota bacterium]